MTENPMRTLLDAIAQQLHDEGPDEFHGTESTSCRFCRQPDRDVPEIGSTECGWNPAQASTDCDFDKDCPVHGAGAAEPPRA